MWNKIKCLFSFHDFDTSTTERVSRVLPVDKSQCRNCKKWWAFNHNIMASMPWEKAKEIHDEEERDIKRFQEKNKGKL